MDLRYIGFEVHRPSSKGTKLLLPVIKAIINQYCLWLSWQRSMYARNLVPNLKPWP